MPPLNEEQMQVMMNEDVKKALWILNGLLDGTKKLVIQSEPYIEQIAYEVEPGGERMLKTLTGYRHTFRVEDAGS